MGPGHLCSLVARCCGRTFACEVVLAVDLFKRAEEDLVVLLEGEDGLLLLTVGLDVGLREAELGEDLQPAAGLVELGRAGSSSVFQHHKVQGAEKTRREDGGAHLRSAPGGLHDGPQPEEIDVLARQSHDSEVGI